MKTEKGTIQHFMENNFPDHFANGKWGCQLMTYMEHHTLYVPKHAFKVSVGDGKKYWVWLDKD